ncbi:hypothetical protein MtrunA17_Chr4g0072931 [Medicago truncatula]|uniref:Uncharacterized protein n=1 Tax=Medicago truncatula TaxID=3880 RepID=A0A396IJE7_MEDTR|nr:hypothetical protein MtrunA17_Chr4g0072931 [Medicago truncatula]
MSSSHESSVSPTHLHYHIAGDDYIYIPLFLFVLTALHFYYPLFLAIPFTSFTLVIMTRVHPLSVARMVKDRNSSTSMLVLFRI